ncbi:hypothetical protein L3X38_027772 [Prunus dulcis]|uniref:U1-type domain-containing protein n=1 Tax=Prunus dulcis TaxID=3755 RepID=A0AAD4Z0N1_PRUDU|nr:hypothetical protein L3X38_027772 [Prunus dulcis]
MDQQHQLLLAQQQQLLYQQFQALQQQEGFIAYQSNQSFCFRFQHPQQQQYHQQQQGYYQSNYANVYHHHQQLLQQQQPVRLSQSRLVQAPGIPVLPGLDPTAAVLSRLAQFSGSRVGAVAERPLYQPVGQPPYSSGGERGGEPFKGHQGNFGYNHLRPSGAGPSFIGRPQGCGSGGPKHFSQHGFPSTSSHPESSVAPATLLPEKSESASALKSEVPNKTKVRNNQSPQVAWCEICKAACNSLEILENHKNGQRHKKNMKKMEKMKNAIRSGDELQGQQNRTSNSNLEVSHLTQCAQDGEQNKPTENLPTEAVNHVKSAETEQQNNIPGQQHGPKRKKKHKITSETETKKIVIPLICDICNVKCDRQGIFDHHLSGKKHVANFKRFKSSQAICGPVGLQALYPPNPIAQTIFHPQEGKYMPPHVYQEVPVGTSSSP